MRHLGEAVGERGDAERDEAVAGARELGAVRQPEGEPAERTADEVAHHQPGGELPEHRVREPLAQLQLARPARGGESDGQVDEREGQAVVEAGLRGQREARLVLAALARRADLHVAREHRIGRRERRPEEEGGGGAKAEERMAEEGESQDRQRHGEGEEPPGHAPGAEREGAVDLQARAHERDQDHRFRQALGQLQVLLQPGRRARRARDREQKRAEGDAEDRQRERQLLQRHRQPGGHEHDRAEPGDHDDVGFHLPRTPGRVRRFRRRQVTPR